MNRRAGTIFFTVNGERHDAVGEFTYDIGEPKREALVGADVTHGYKETQKVAFIEGELRDKSDLDLAALFNVTDATVTLELANGKNIILRNAWYAGDGTVGTENANIACRFEGLSGEED